jgi:OOP family OmpA-OmpF porin
MKNKWLVLTALVGMTGAAFAADDANHWYLTPNAGYLWTDHDRDAHNDIFYGLSFGRHLGDYFALELNGLSSKHEGFAGSSDLRLSTVSLDALVFLAPQSKWSPYFTVGAGAIRDDLLSGGKQDNAMAQGGFGMLIRAWSSPSGTSTFSLKPAIKARWDYNNASHKPVDYMAGMGFEFSFGAPAHPEPATRVEPPPPPPPPPAETAPAAPPPPADSDHDGVTDDLDKCPNTPIGVSVDANGCPLKGKVTLEGVTFETNSATLTGQSDTVLNKVADDLKKHPRLKVELQGHTDSVGSDAYNQKLSARRAAAVRDYLVQQGVSPTQLTSKGYGESVPVGDNKTAEGRAQNRRVVMSVLENPGDVDVKGQGKATETAR